MQARAGAVGSPQSEGISKQEWLDFWANVVANKYSVSDLHGAPAPERTRDADRPHGVGPQEEDISEEIDSMLSGGSWVDWDDGRTT